MTYVKSMSFSQAARKHWPMVKFQNFTSPSCDRHWPPINLWHQFHLTKSAVLNKVLSLSLFVWKMDVTMSLFWSFLSIFPPLRRLRRLEHYGLTSPLPGTSHSLPQRLCRESVSPSSGSNLGMLGKYSEIFGDSYRDPHGFPSHHGFQYSNTWMIWGYPQFVETLKDIEWHWKTPSTEPNNENMPCLHLLILSAGTSKTLFINAKACWNEMLDINHLIIWPHIWGPSSRV